MDKGPEELWGNIVEIRHRLEDLELAALRGVGVVERLGDLEAHEAKTLKKLENLEKTTARLDGETNSPDASIDEMWQALDKTSEVNDMAWDELRKRLENLEGVMCVMSAITGAYADGVKDLIKPQKEPEFVNYICAVCRSIPIKSYGERDIFVCPACHTEYPGITAFQHLQRADKP